MAITILLQPQPFQAVYNETMLVLDSTKKTLDGFQYVVDINIDGTFSSRMKISSNLQGFGVIDLHKHIEPFVSFNIDHSATPVFQKMEDSFTKYDVTLAEEYIYEPIFSTVTNNGGFAQLNYSVSFPHFYEVGDKIIIDSGIYAGNATVTNVASTTVCTVNLSFIGTSINKTKRFDGSTTIVTGSTVMSGNTFAVNSALPFFDVSSFDYTDYQLRTGTTGQFLSTIPSTNKLVDINDRVWSNIYNDLNQTAFLLKIVSDQGEFLILNSSFSTSNDANKFLTIGVGPWNITNATVTTVVSGSLPIITENTPSYTVQLLNSSFSATSEELTFVLDKPCTKFENFRMIYLDRFGSFLSVNFDLASKKSIKTKRKSYQKNFGSYNSTTNTYGWSPSDRGRTHLDSNIKESFTIQTNYVNEDIGQQVLDLMVSPEVYHLTDGVSKIEDVVLRFYSDTGGFATFETFNNHNFTVGTEINVIGISGPIDGLQIVRSITSDLKFVTDKAFTSPTIIPPSSVARGNTFTGGGELRAVNIKTSRLQEKQRVTDKLINYKIDFEYASENIVQRG